MGRLEFSSWAWWYISGGISPREIFQGVLLMGWGSGEPKVVFCHITVPSAISWSVFPVKFSIIVAVPFFYAMCEWVYALVPIPGVYILPCLVQYAWFIPSDCVAKFRYSSGLIELMSNSSCPAKRNHRGRGRGPK